MTAPPEAPRFDPAAVVPVLDEPAFGEVKALVSREAWSEAANRLESLIVAAHATNPAVWYQLGRLQTQAGRRSQAIAAFDRASTVDWPLLDHARLHAARLLLEQGDASGALARFERIGGVSTLIDDVVLGRAAALAASRRVDEAAPIWRAHLARDPLPTDWQSEAFRFARALLEEPSVAHAEEAARVASLVIHQSPFGWGSSEARDIERRAVDSLPEEQRQRMRGPDVAQRIAEARQLADSSQGSEALAAADAVIAQLARENGDSGEAGCEAHTARGKALAAIRQHGLAAEAFGAAMERCEGNALATATFLGARAAWRDGRPALARQRYSDLERRHRDHRLADDARLHGAQTARELGDLVGFTSMLLAIADDYPDGDMVDQGLFELALERIEQGDWAGAVQPLERSLERQVRGRPYTSEGRPQYFLARARIELGQTDLGKELLAGVIREFPLSYFMVLAYSRLASIDASLAARVLEEARAAEPQGLFVIPDHAELHRPEFLRAIELVRQGETAAALREFEFLGIRDKRAHPSVAWAAASLLARIEAPAESHGILRSVELWADHHPAGVWRPLWELAYPRPYLPLVDPATRRFGVPEHLVYAIMREESAFRPGVASAAGAHGLMQLVVPTAKLVAKPLGFACDERALRVPAVNITLGTRYLSELVRRFGDHPLLAIPGYNAGPNAPARWVREAATGDFDVFVERIPYTETRDYTKRVIRTMAAYATLYGKGVEDALVLPPLKVRPSVRVTASAGVPAASSATTSLP